MFQLRVIALFAAILFSGFFFHRMVVGVNAVKFENETYRRVQHPDFIPSRLSIAVAGGWYDLAIGDMYWLETIQYVGTHAVGAEYRAYLATLLELVTDIDPRMVDAYIFGQTLLPRELDEYQGEDRHLNEAIGLGEKWLVHLCDARKIRAIDMALDIASLPVDESTREPCETLWIPFYLGYDHYFYANDPEKANRYYKIASAHADAPAGVRTIAATTLSDSGDPTAAMEMLLDLAIFSGESAPACSSVAGTLKRLYSEYFQEGILSYSFIDPVREAKRFIDVYERVRTVESGLCREYILRLERMTQLAHVRQADEAYFRDHDGAHAKDADTLYRIGYLPYEPRDFQQLPDGSWAAYVRDEETGRWVVRMRTPDGRISDPRKADRY